jgi:protein TonB
MFSTLESTWDHSARRGWTTIASFTMQALALGLLLAISWLWVGRLPQVRWLQISAPASFTPPPAAAQTAGGHHGTSAPAIHRAGQIVAPPSIPEHIAPIHDADLGPSAPDLPVAAIGPGRGWGDPVSHGIGDAAPVVIAARPVAAKPLVLSHLAEANLLRKVQPAYPPLARQAGVQGAVELRAIISKTGTIENLVVVSGHPMLAAAAVEAVRQWRYRPYLLNNEPVEVETESTVNFLLSGG